VNLLAKDVLPLELDEVVERARPASWAWMYSLRALPSIPTRLLPGQRGPPKQAIGYLASPAATLEYDIFVWPLEYYGNGKRVAQLGGEIFRVNATGVPHEADWASVPPEDGRITRMLAIKVRRLMSLKAARQMQYSSIAPSRSRLGRLRPSARDQLNGNYARREASHRQE
jgi:hypothetical protein